jgi:glycosyltransferase involved in cell wall biosynthesis
MMKSNKNTPSILFIAPIPPPVTGQSIASLALREDLKLHKHKVHVINLSKESFRSGFNSLGRVFEIVGVIFKVLMARLSTSQAYFTVAESVAGNLKDLFIYVCLLGRLDTTYIHLHGGAGMRILLSQRHPWLRRINGIFLKRLAGVIVLGERLASIYDNLVAPDRLHIVRNFAPDDTFVNISDLRNKLSSHEPIRILYLSNLLPGKGYIDLLEAVKLLPPNILEGLQINFAGGFETESDHKNFLEAIKGVSQVKYHGTVQGELKKQLLKQANIFCLPTYYPYEGQPISILEAYASGCAVLTTDHSGIFDIFTPGVNGLEVEKKNPQSIAAAITTLTTDTRQLRKFCVVNARTARVEYRIEKHLQQVRRALQIKSE